MTSVPLTAVLLVVLAIGGTHALSALILNGYHGGEKYSPFLDNSGPVKLNFNHLGFGKLLNINGDAYWLGGMSSHHSLSEKVYVHVANSEDSTNGAPLPLAVIGMAAASGEGTAYKAYMCGGAAAYKGVAMSSCFKLTSDGSQWVTMKRYPEAIAYASMLILNGSPYVFGGSRTDGPDDVVVTDAVYMYDDDSDTWKAVANMPSPVAYMASAVFNPSQSSQGPSDQAILCGGWITPSGSKTAISSCNIYDAGRNTWKEGPQLNAVRAYGSLAWLNGELMCIGGWGSKDYKGLTTVEKYNPHQNTWQVLSNKLKFTDYAATAISYTHL